MVVEDCVPCSLTVVTVASGAESRYHVLPLCCPNIYVMLFLKCISNPPNAFKGTQVVQIQALAVREALPMATLEIIIASVHGLFEDEGAAYEDTLYVERKTLHSLRGKKDIVNVAVSPRALMIANNKEHTHRNNDTCN